MGDALIEGYGDTPINRSRQIRTYGALRYVVEIRHAQ